MSNWPTGRNSRGLLVSDREASSQSRPEISCLANSSSVSALAAALPLMFSFGAGAELRRPLGLAIFGGLVLSQLLTLFTTPVIYLAFDRLAQRMGRRHEDEAVA